MSAGYCVTPLKMAYYRGPLGRAPLLGTLEDMLRKALDMGISLRRGPFVSEGNLESGRGGLVYWGLRMMNEGGP